MRVQNTFLVLGLAAIQVCHGRLLPGSTVLRFNFLPLQSETSFGIYIRGGDPNHRGADAPCREIYEQYLAARDAEIWSGEGNAFSLVYESSDCILEALSSMEAQTVSSAAVLLGLVPILFATLGPSLSELGLISLQKPVLGVLFSVGTVVSLPSRVLSFYDDEPKDILKRPAGLGRGFNRWLQRRNYSRRTATNIVVGVLEYPIAAAAVFNILYTSWQLGVASIFILSSTLTASGYPLVWNLIPLVVHGVVATSFHIVNRARHNSSEEFELQQPLSPSAPNFDQPQERTGTSPQSHQTQQSWLTLQFVPSYAHPPIPQRVVERHWLTELAHNIATCGSFAQILYGTIVFSSLLFVAAADVAIIMLRYAASVLACRLLIAFELGGMELENISEKDRYADASTSGGVVHVGKA